MIKRIVVIIIYFIIATNNLYSQKVVRVGAFNFYPAIFQDKDGEIKGFYVDAFHEIETKENIQFQYVFGTWNECLERIKNDEIDVMVSVAYTNERGTYLDYCPTPLLTVWGDVYVKETTEIHGILDLEGKTIAVMKSDINGEQLKVLAEKLSINCIFIEKADFQEVFKSIASNEGDAGVVNNTFGAGKSKEYDLRSSGIVFNPFNIHITVQKNKNTELLNLLDKYLDDWLQDENSVYNISRQKWSHDKVGTIQVTPKWLKNLLISIIAIAILLAVFIVLLRNRVKKATIKIEKSESKFRELYEKSGDAIVINQNGAIVDFNQAMVKLFGYHSKEEFMGVHPSQISPEFQPDGTSSLEKVEEVLNLAALNGTHRFEWMHKKREGEDFLCEILVTLIIDDPNNRIFHGVIREITSYKQIEQELIKAKETANSSLQQIKVIQANTSNVIWKWDIEKVINFKNCYISEAVDKFLALPDGSINNSMDKFFSYILPEYLSVVDDAIKKAIKKPNELIFIEYEVKKANGKLAWFASSGKVVPENGKLTIYGSTIDITEQKQRENELLLKNIAFDSSIAANSTADTNGILTNVNTAFLNLWGYESSDEVIGKSIAEFIKYEQDATKIINSLNKNEYWSGEFTALKKDGTEFIALVNASTLKDINNNFIGYQSSAVDITEIRRAEKKLQNTFDLSPSIIAKADMNIGRFTQVNKTITKLLGYTAEEFTSKPYMEFVHPNDRQSTIDIATEQLKGNEVTFFENRYLCKDGSYKWIAWHGTKPDENGVVTTIGSDIHVRKVIEQEIVKTKQLLEESQTITHVGGWELDILTSKLFWTAETYRIHDTSPEEFNPTVDAGVGYFLPKSRQIISEALKAAIESGKGYDLILETLTTKGRKIDVRTTCAVTFQEGRPAKLTGIFQDITEQKYIQQELISAKEQAQESEKKLLEAQELSHVGSWEYIVDSDTVTWSKELYNIFEHPYNLPAPKFSEQRTFYTEESFTRLQKAVDDCVQREIPYEIGLDIFASSGSIKHIISKGEVKRENNKIVGSYGTAQDVTVQKQLELQLIQAKEKAEESENRFGKAISNAPFPIMIHSEGEVIMLSNSWTRITGYSKKDIPTITKWTEKAYGKKAILSKEFINELYELEEEKYDGEWEITTSDKNKRIWEFMSTPLGKYPNGRRIVSSMAVDITERKNGEQQLINAKEKAEESELQFKQLFESEADAVFIASVENGIILDVNRAGEKLMQMQKNEIIGLHQSKLHPENIDEFSTKSFAEHKQSIEKMEAAVLIENKIVRKDGVEVPVEILASKVRYQGKECLIGAFRDITERKKVEEALRKSEEMIISSQSVANICSYSTTLNEIEFEKSTWICSPEFYNIFGIDETYPHTIAGWVGLIHPDYRDKLAAYHEYVVKNKTSFHHQYKIIRINDGVECWVEGTGELEFDTQGNPIRMYGAIQDITDRKKVEKDLIKAKEKAEESDKLKSAFLANMSHEIRTPMNGILGFSELLKNPHLSDSQQQKYIEVIEKSGYRMLNIINDIVDISKIEAGLMDVSLNESNINEQVEYIYTFFKPEVEGKGMQLFFKNGLPTKQAAIKTDREKVFAILTNLVKNAIKYSNEGSIEFGYVLKTSKEGTEKGKKTELEFYIKDTGIGVPKNRQIAIFERFIQADVMDKMARQGAGLGLSITKAYVEMLGGKIWLESEEGVGSTFYFTLPYTMELEVDNSVKDIEVTCDVVNQVKNLKILIAEDDEVSSELLSVIVSEISHEIIKASNGTEAVELCKNNPSINLILMDIQMPEINGYEAIRQIRQFNKNVIIIAQTAYGLTGDREKSLDAGCNDYITKPINKHELDVLIKKYFNK